MKVILVVLGMLSLLLVGSLIFLDKNKDTEEIEHYNPQDEIVFDTYLYYNLDNPEIIYTKDSQGNFVEVNINVED